MVKIVLCLERMQVLNFFMGHIFTEPQKNNIIIVFDTNSHNAAKKLIFTISLAHTKHQDFEFEILLKTVRLW